jgi:tetratricopeptide (TPR) repeat protein
MITQPQRTTAAPSPQRSQPLRLVCYRPTMRLILTASLAVLSLTAPAQMTMPMPDKDTRPVPLVSGLGNSNHAIHTTSPEAQKYFNQGLDYIYAFNHDEARRSFEKAAELDPKAPMPLWGVALAVGPNYNDVDIGNAREKQAFEAITKAKLLAANGPAIERDYIDALAARFAQDTNHDLHIQGQNYAKAMAAVVAQHPDDLDAATLYADSLMNIHPWQLWSADGKPTEGTTTIVSTLQSVLLRDPDHVGANHLLIHAVEASPDPSLALASAKRLGALAPSAGHLVHMPAHIYQRVGDFNDSAAANERAVEVDQAYFRSQHIEGRPSMYNGMYYTHNIHFLVFACNMEGNSTCALDAAAKLVAHVTPQVAGTKVMEWYLPTQPWIMVRFSKWDTILQHPLPPADMPYLTAMYHYARGAAFTATKKPEQAAAERKALADALHSLPPDAIPDFNNSAKSVFELALTALDARIAEAAGDRAKAIALWQKAVTSLDTFAYNEPADWYYPVRESLGGALLRDNQPAAAEAVFRRDLELNPNNGRSLYGLWQSLLLQHRDADAAFVKTQFNTAWSHATITLKISDL